MRESVGAYLEVALTEHITSLRDATFREGVVSALESVKRAYVRGNKLLIAGNGGSAADAQHFAAELVGQYRAGQKSYAALALTTDTSFLTAWSNDVGFEDIFGRQLKALGKKGDVFFAISTSGESPNILEGLRIARLMGIETIALLGKGGGAAHSLADISIVVPSYSTPHIQECHITAIHCICEHLTA